jgi:protease-4
LTTAGTNQYLLAAACDEIILAPPGMLMVPGVRLEMTFFKDMQGKHGLEEDMLKMGKCKGAAEPFTRSSMSPALRENLEALVDDSYEQMVAMIAKDRKLEDYQVKTLLDQGLFTAAAARKAGLVDRVAYADELLDDLRKKHKKDELKVVTDYKKKRSRAEFSGLTGMIKMMELMLGGRPTAHVTGKKQIAVVYAVGSIVQGKSSKGILGGSVLGSSTIVKALRTAAKNPNVRAIVLRVDSPGGSSVASDLIWREIVKIKKPVIASMGDIAGSGGYYISMGADKIFAEPGTLTGSIGVVGG